MAQFSLGHWDQKLPVQQACAEDRYINVVLKSCSTRQHVSLLKWQLDL
jgi:hypothetical protein